MPELPEVQTVVDGLNKKIKGRTILAVSYCDAPKLIRGMSISDFSKKIQGEKIEKVGRRANNIFIYLSSGKVIHVHLKMTGHFIFTDDEYVVKDGKWQGNDLPSELQDPINQFIHVVIRLSGGKQLAFSDMRKFGFLHLVDGKGVEEVDKKHGPEPIDNQNFNLKIFQEIIKSNSGKPIKALLLDQKKIAGIGNIYGDEILFLSSVLPARKAGSLSKKEVEKIFKNIEPVLKRAIMMRGTSIGDFRDTDGRKGEYQDSRLVYGREKKPCPVCGTIISRIKIAQRSAHFCSKCQK